MDTEHALGDQWPDDEPVRDEQPEPPRSRRERIVRFLGDAFLTAGMFRVGGAGGRRDGADLQATTNVTLYGEGESEGREANRGSESERR
jgi:hypothetical protein